MSLDVAAVWLLTAAAGAACAGLVRVPLRLEERAALAAVLGILGGSAVTLVVGLVTGLSRGAALLGPILLLALAYLAGDLLGRRQGPSPLDTWRAGWREAAAARFERDTWVMGAVVVFAAVGFWRLFAHSLFPRADGSIAAGFSTVWADWSLHSTLASSFSLAGNLPPQDPIFSGGVLRYPFLPDFQSGALEAAGASPESALAIPCAVLCAAAAVLVVSIGRRLSGTLAVGILATLLCLAGGGLGWRTIWWDACDASGHARADCAPSQAVRHPGTSLDVLGLVRTVVGDQPRDYDNLQNSDATLIGDSTSAPATATIQWYTPLLAWWLPQRTFVYGFAAGTAILLLVVAGLRAPPPARSPFVAAGLLAGILPLVHIHTLIALAVVLGLLALVHRRREWLWLIGIAAVMALPRLIQVAGSGTGVSHPDCPAQSTHFPFFEVGWKSLGRDPTDPCAVPGYSDLSLGGQATALWNLVRLPFHTDFWAFWLDNQGIVVPLSLAVAIAAALAQLRRPAGVAATAARAGRRTLDALSPDLVRFCLPFLAVFLVSNVVVFQTWDWDNTKLLAWWYLGGALLTGAWITACWRRGGWASTAATVALVSLLLSGGLSTLRVLQGEGSGQGGPYTWASRADAALAAAVVAQTPGKSVFLLPEVAAYAATAPNQPVATLAGRTSLLGYGGWLYSYGVDTGTRPQDRRTIYQGCAAAAQRSLPCAASALIARYGIDFVLVPPDAPGVAWFNATFPMVVSGDAGAVYDVRGARQAAASTPAGTAADRHPSP